MDNALIQLPGTSLQQGITSGKMRMLPDTRSYQNICVEEDFHRSKPGRADISFVPSTSDGFLDFIQGCGSTGSIPNHAPIHFAKPSLSRHTRTDPYLVSSNHCLQNVTRRQMKSLPNLPG
jgi:hypothetical protein